MYLSVPSFPNPFSTTPLTDAFLYITLANFDFLTFSGRLEVGVYADEASAKAQLPPITRISYPIPSASGGGLPTIDDQPYRLPTLQSLVQGNAEVFGELTRVFYGLVMQDPRFKGATIVGEG